MGRKDVKGKRGRMCPLLSIHQEENFECQRAQCMWYNQKFKQCAVVLAAAALQGLSYVTEKEHDEKRGF